MDSLQLCRYAVETYKYLIQIHFKLCSTILNFSIKKITVKYFTHKMLYTGDKSVIRLCFQLITLLGIQLLT